MGQIACCFPLRQHWLTAEERLAAAGFVVDDGGGSIADLVQLLMKGRASCAGGRCQFSAKAIK